MRQASPSSISRQQSAASMAPAAPRVWLVSILVELQAPSLSAKQTGQAWLSISSLSRVAVPCRLM